mmetsp:Transcript_40323/g.125721  ORF Transcript_40323/g.125721 Transcript_40323/m.125721 type:complete len:293 (-) Transcript_40323:1574-2452(-)
MVQCSGPFRSLPPWQPRADKRAKASTAARGAAAVRRSLEAPRRRTLKLTIVPDEGSCTRAGPTRVRVQARARARTCLFVGMRARICTCTHAGAALPAYPPLLPPLADVLETRPPPPGAAPPADAPPAAAWALGVPPRLAWATAAPALAAGTAVAFAAPLPPPSEAAPPADAPPAAAWALGVPPWLAWAMAAPALGVGTAVPLAAPPPPPPPPVAPATAPAPPALPPCLGPSSGTLAIGAGGTLLPDAVEIRWLSSGVVGVAGGEATDDDPLPLLSFLSCCGDRLPEDRCRRS